MTQEESVIRELDLASNYDRNRINMLSFFTTKMPGPDKIYQTHKEEIVPIFYKLLQKKMRQEHFPIYFMKLLALP